MTSIFKNQNKIGQILSENIDDLIVIINEEFQCEYINFQYSNETIKINDLIHSEDLNRIIELLKSIFKIGYGADEAKIILENKIFNWYEIKGRKFVDNEDNKEKILLICRDISKFKKLEFEYKKSQARFGVITNTLPEFEYWKLLVSKEGIVAVQKTREMLELVIDNIPQLIYWKDTNLVYLGCNRSFASKNELKDPSNVIGKTDKDLIWVKNNLEYIQTCERNVILNDNPEYNVIESLIAINGNDTWFEMNRIPLHNLEGKVVGILSTYEDITTRKIGEQRLEESEEKYRTILDNIKESYFEVDLKGNITFFNDSLCELIEIPREELLGLNYQNYIKKENKNKVIDVYREVYKSGNPNSNFQFQFLKKDGKKVTCESSIYLRYDSKGNKIGFKGFARNITEKFFLEQKIKESETKYRHLFENSPYSIILVDRRGQIIDGNPATEKIFKKSAELLIGKHFLSVPIKPEKNLNLFKQRYDLLLKGKVLEPIETQILRENDKRLIWINIDNSLVKIGKETVFQVIIQDITEKKKVEQNLKNSQEELKNLNKELEQKVKERTKDFIKSEQQYRTTINSLADPLHVVNKDLEIILINQKLKDWLNELNVNQFITGFKILEAFPFLGQDIYEEYQKVFKTGNPLITMESTILPDLQVITETRKIPIFSEGNVIQVITIIRDITESKKIEDQLIESEKKFRNMVNNLDVGFYKGELKGKLTMHNQAVNKILGLKPSDNIVGLKSTQFFTNPDVLEEYYDKLLKNGFIRNFIGHVKKVSGEILTVELNAHLIYNSEGQPSEVEGTFTDITEKFKLEQELLESEIKLRQQNIELKKLDKTKNDFIVNVTHELKTPMISIAGYTDYILMKHRNQLNSELTEDLLTVQRNINRFGVLMDQLLEALKIDEHKLGLDKKMQNVSKIISDCFDDLSYLINEKNLEVILNIESNIILSVDYTRLFAVFTNLLSNAIKFTPDYGWIEVTSKKEKNKYKFEIKDNGIGLSQDEIKQLFKKFGQIRSPIINKNINIKYSGTGLGLYIAKGIIKAHGGKIWAQSKGQDKGSVFSFTLPV